MNAATKFLNAIPVLSAPDIAAAVEFYEQKLGFTADFQSDDYAGLHRGGVQLHLWLTSDSQLAKNTGCRVNVSGIDVLYEEYQAQNLIHPNGAITTKLWGLREFAVLDLSGNCLTFAEAPSTSGRRDRTD